VHCPSTLYLTKFTMENSGSVKYFGQLLFYFVPLFTFFFLVGASNSREPLPPQEHFSDGFSNAPHLSHLFGILIAPVTAAYEAGTDFRFPDLTRTPPVLQ
jgi:hypothetical protein